MPVWLETFSVCVSNSLIKIHFMTKLAKIGFNLHDLVVVWLEYFWFTLPSYSDWRGGETAIGAISNSKHWRCPSVRFFSIYPERSKILLQLVVIHCGLEHLFRLLIIPRYLGLGSCDSLLVYLRLKDFKIDLLRRLGWLHSRWIVNTDRALNQAFIFTGFKYLSDDVLFLFLYDKFFKQLLWAFSRTRVWINRRRIPWPW